MITIILLLALLLTPPMQAFPQDLFGLIAHANRKTNAKMIRSAATNEEAQLPVQPQITNGDEQLYPDKRGSYGKALKQLDTGLVDPVAFNSLVFATQTGNPADFNKIILQLNPRVRGMVEPQAGIDFNLWGADASTYSMVPPPTVVSAERADEMVELYWMRLLADVNFTDYDTNPLAAEAITDLNDLTAFTGPKVDGQVTPQTLFRSDIPGVLTGPFISQLFLLNVSFSDTTFVQKYTAPTSNSLVNNFMTNVPEYTRMQDGFNPTRSITLGSPLYIKDARALAGFVHNDPEPLPGFFAMLILLGMANKDPKVYDQANPYLTNPTQQQFVDFTETTCIALVSLANLMGIRASWYQKWFVQRTLRPEEYGFLVQQQQTGAFNYGLNQEVFNSTALPLIFALNAATNAALTPPVSGGTYLLPQSYPEGSPTHPTYPQGHATSVGAWVTILKAYFNEDYIMSAPTPVAPQQTAFVPSFDGTTLVPTTDVLTIGGELNKLAVNIATGRDMAGIHFRSDCTEGLLLGEQVAISILNDWAYTNNINFAGFSLTKFDGTKITVGGNKRIPLL